MRVKTFFLTPVPLRRIALRRYRSTHILTPDGESLRNSSCPLPWGYHDESTVVVDAEPQVENDHDALAARFADDPRWPTHCACGYAFQADDTKQVFDRQLHSGAPDGKLYTLQDAPVGAMWDAEWMRHGDTADGPWTGPDGMTLVVKTPGGDWVVDSECSNCTRTQYTQVDERTRRWTGRTHYCWVRTGDPRTGVVHVSKDGNTCAAGAGSIGIGGFHGFLHHGELYDT